MSTVCSFVDRRAGAEVAARLMAMQAALAPHARGELASWFSGPAGLGAGRGMTLPEDQWDREPVLEDGLVVAADIRLDNRDELQRELDVDAARATRMSDSAWLRLAWRRWAADCVHHLVGDFAFAVWDERESTLFCARDPVGRRPLFYAQPNGALAVASAPAALLALPGVSKDIDEDRLARRLLLLPAPGDRSFFADVSMLPPGHSIRATPAGLQVAAYHRFQRRTIRYRRDDDYVQHFLQLFDRAVRDRLRANGPVASMLSAGLDSGSVTAVAARALAGRGETLMAVTWRPRAGASVPPVPGYLTDESAQAAEAAAMYTNLTHVFVEAPDHSPVPMLTSIVTGMNEPVFNPTNAALFAATGITLQSRGCRVLLSGAGGNKTISYDGPARLRSLVRPGRLLTLASMARTLWRRGSRLRPAVDMLAPVLPQPVTQRLLAVDSRRRWARAGVFSGINLEFAAEWAARGDNLRLPARRARRDSWTARTEHLAGRDDHGPKRLHMEAAFGLEMRDPTLDLRVIDFCLSIPDDQFLRHGVSRSLIRRAMQGLLPEATLVNTRRGLQSPDWPRFVAPYRSDLAACLDDLEDVPLAARALDIPGLRRLIDDWPPEWTSAHAAAYQHKLLRAISAGLFVARCGSHG